MMTQCFTILSKTFYQQKPTVKVDGKTVDTEDSVRVLKVEHAVVATLDGCKSIRRIVELGEDDGDKTVKLVFKKPDPEQDSEQ